MRVRKERSERGISRPVIPPGGFGVVQMNTTPMQHHQPPSMPMQYRFSMINTSVKQQQHKQTYGRVVGALVSETEEEFISDAADDPITYLPADSNTASTGIGSTLLLSEYSNHDLGDASGSGSGFHSFDRGHLY